MHAFTLTNPTKPALPVIASIPHTGTYVPEDIKQLFASSDVARLPMTDWFLHELYDFLPDLGISSIAANYSRYVIDLNRSPVSLELYPGRFETKLVSDKDFQGNEIFSNYPSAEQISSYKKTVHQPYHDALENLIQEAINTHGQAYVFDLHSIAKHATIIHSELDKDIYLGNRDGKSCTNEWLAFIEQEFLQNKLSVQKNSPYKGGYITHHYGLASNVQAIQIEMNQSLYLPQDNVVEEDCAMVVLGSEFIATKNKLKSIFKALINKLSDS